MRGIAVLALAFVFAFAVPLVDTAVAQSSEPAPSPTSPEEYKPEPTDAVLVGRVLDGAGRPVGGASVSSYNYGGPVSYAESDGGGSSGSGGSAAEPARAPYYGGNQTTSAADGSYRLGVYSGSNSVSVYRDGYAQATVQVEVQSGQTVTQDLTVQKFPDKTARLQGRVTDARTGAGLPSASISVSNPLYGAYECSTSSTASSGGGSKPMPAEDGDAASTSIVAPDYSYRGCAITVDSDGRFEGLVTPGYSIVSVYAYSECAMSMDADGSSSSSCGPQYFSFSRTLDLPANATTTVNAALRSPAGPDATVSGYLIDAESGKAIPGAQISFSNQEAYGYGWATTDGDGSYSIRLRSGVHQVSVSADGHLPWEGTFDVDAGESDLDVRLTPGQAAYGGGCCWLYAREGMAAASEGAAGAPPPSPQSPGAMGDGDDLAESDGSGQEVLYQDLGGGLGPYDADRRAFAAADDGSGAGFAEGDEGSGPDRVDIPAGGPVATLATLALVLGVLARRRLG